MCEHNNNYGSAHRSATRAYFLPSSKVPWNGRLWFSNPSLLLSTFGEWWLIVGGVRGYTHVYDMFGGSSSKCRRSRFRSSSVLSATPRCQLAQRTNEWELCYDNTTGGFAIKGPNLSNIVKVGRAGRSPTERVALLNVLRFWLSQQAGQGRKRAYTAVPLST